MFLFIQFWFFWEKAKEKRHVRRTFEMGSQQSCIYFASVGFFSFLYSPLFFIVFHSFFFASLAVDMFHGGATIETSCMLDVYRLKEKIKAKRLRFFLHSAFFYSALLIVSYFYSEHLYSILSMGLTSWKYFLVVLSLSTSIQAFYLPGLAPNVFCKTPIPDSKCKVY